MRGRYGKGQGCSPNLEQNRNWPRVDPGWARWPLGPKLALAVCPCESMCKCGFKCGYGLMTSGTNQHMIPTTKIIATKNV